MRDLREIRTHAGVLKTGLLTLIVFVIGYAAGAQQIPSLAQSDTRPPRGIEESFAPFWQAFNLIQDQYLDRANVSPEILVDGAIKGMIDGLGDQFSGYMDPRTYPLLNDDLSGEVKGIGAVIETIEATNEIRIVHVLEGSPAEGSGILPGDIFVEVDGQDVTSLNQLELVGKVRGPEGTIVELKMRRGDQLIEFSVRRARITVPTVESQTLESNIGYVRLREFTPGARQQMDEAIRELSASRLDGLVLDLRGNPGGLLSSAIDIASAFLKDGTILIEDFGNGNEQVFSASGKPIDSAVPLVVLVDENSASASELVAGALQDRERATIVGETTFGKGTVQTWQSLVNGGGVRLTIARWLTPNRKWIHGNGITPDIIVEQNEPLVAGAVDAQLEAAVKSLIKNRTKVIEIPQFAPATQ